AQRRPGHRDGSRRARVQGASAVDAHADLSRAARVAAPRADRRREVRAHARGLPTTGGDATQEAAGLEVWPTSRVLGQVAVGQTSIDRRGLGARPPDFDSARFSAALLELEAAPARTQACMMRSVRRPWSTAARMLPARRTRLIGRRWCSWPPSWGMPSRNDTPNDVPNMAISMSCVARPLPANSTLT